MLSSVSLFAKVVQRSVWEHKTTGARPIKQLLHEDMQGPRKIKRMKTQTFQRAEEKLLSQEGSSSTAITGKYFTISSTSASFAFDVQSAKHFFQPKQKRTRRVKRKKKNADLNKLQKPGTTFINLKFIGKRVHWVLKHISCFCGYLNIKKCLQMRTNIAWSCVARLHYTQKTTTQGWLISNHICKKRKSKKKKFLKRNADWHSSLKAGNTSRSSGGCFKFCVQHSSGTTWFQTFWLVTSKSVTMERVRTAGMTKSTGWHWTSCSILYLQKHLRNCCWRFPLSVSLQRICGGFGVLLSLWSNGLICCFRIAVYFSESTWDLTGKSPSKSWIMWNVQLNSSFNPLCPGFVHDKPTACFVIDSFCCFYQELYFFFFVPDVLWQQFL